MNDGIQQVYWSSLAKIYDSLYQSSYSQKEDNYIRSRLAPLSGTILDIGCGTGLGYQLLGQPANYTGVDISIDMLNVAEEKYPNANWIAASMDNLSFIHSKSIDAVIGLNGSLSYSSNPYAAVSHIMRVLKVGGRVVLMVHNQYALSRLLHWTVQIDRLSTRKMRNGATLARYYDVNNFTRLFTGFDLQVEGMSFLGRVAEYGGLWKLDRALCKVAPGLAYNLVITGVKYA